MSSRAAPIEMLPGNGAAANVSSRLGQVKGWGWDCSLGRWIWLHAVQWLALAIHYWSQWTQQQKSLRRKAVPDSSSWSEGMRDSGDGNLIHDTLGGTDRGREGYDEGERGGERVGEGGRQWRQWGREMVGDREGERGGRKKEGEGEQQWGRKVDWEVEKGTMEEMEILYEIKHNEMERKTNSCSKQASCSFQQELESGWTGRIELVCADSSLQPRVGYIAHWELTRNENMGRVIHVYRVTFNEITNWKQWQKLRDLRKQLKWCPKVSDRQLNIHFHEREYNFTIDVSIVLTNIASRGTDSTSGSVYS